MLTSLFSLGLLACTPDPEDSGPADTGAEIDVLSFFIYDPFTADDAPVEGVTVAFDTIDGERLEVISGADGLAAVELDRDRFASAIGHADGRSFVVYTAESVIPSFTPGEVLAEMPSWSLGSTSSLPVSAGTSWVSISGEILNKADDDNAVLISGTTSTEVFQDSAGPTSFELTVPAGQDFSLVALEFELDKDGGNDRVIEHVFRSWVVLDHPAVSGSTTIDIDFADAIVPSSIVGSVKAPSDEILRTQGTMFIELFAGGACTGFSPSTAPGADGVSYDFRAEYVEVAGHSLRSAISIGAPDGSTSSLWMGEGIPSEGAQDPGLLTPPRLIDSTRDGPSPWEQQISWTPASGGATYVVYLTGSGQIGVVSTGPGETEFALPPLPSTSTMLTTGTITGVLVASESPDEVDQIERQATDAPFALASPL